MANTVDGKPMRGKLARVGVAALNIIQPGLGLIRLSNWRVGITYMLVPFAALLFAWCAFLAVRIMSFQAYAIIVGTILIIALSAYVGAIVDSWRSSAYLQADPPWWSRWYGLVAGLLSWPISDLLRSRYRLFSIPSVSMEPTLLQGDRLLARIHSIDPLRRGDVVIVRKGEVNYVKRIAAVPGDRISIDGGTIWINGNASPQKSDGSNLPKSDDDIAARVVSERFVGELKPHRILDTEISDSDFRAEVRLGAGQFYLLGDNRDRSADSRHALDVGGLGLVDRQNIIGKASFIYWRKGQGWGEQALQ